MSESKNKAVFEQILNDIRSDLENIKKLHSVLVSKVGNGLPDKDTQIWIMDAFIDKLYELEAKIIRIFKDVTNKSPGNATSAIHNLASCAHTLAFLEHQQQLNNQLSNLEGYLNAVIRYVELDFSYMRSQLRISEWKELEKVKPVEYVSVERKRYVTAREELAKAKANLSDHPEDVMNHLRTTIDLAIKERFGFKRIQPMQKFLEDADRLNFPLPSYSLIYSYFSQGTGRIHEGKIHTQFEAKEAIRTVSNFIDDLELIDISQKQIDEFKKQSNYVD